LNTGALANRALNIEDLRKLAQRRLPRMLFEHVDRGAEDEFGLRRNRDALDRLAFIPRVLNDVTRPKLAVSLFGKPAALPVGISATGGASLCWRDGDIALARAAKAAGTPLMISGGAMTSLERICAEGGRLWYQHYPRRDPAYDRELVAQAQHLGCEALVVTVDSAVPPNREFNQRNGFALPIRPRMLPGLSVMSRPEWALTILLPILLSGSLSQAEQMREIATHNFTWDSLVALRRVWRGTMMVKGVLSPADARRAVDLGCDGVVVSNHGGRNLDQAISAIEALPAVVDAVDGRGAVLFDSGIRRGADVVKALALGANFTLVGRATLFGLAAAGQPGVSRALAILKAEIRRTMALCGATSVETLSRELLA
jgi:(S)-mandelate dehydrogenase